MQNLVLDLRELLLHARVGHDERVFRLREVLALLHHHRAEQLVLQTILGDEEVQRLTFTETSGW